MNREIEINKFNRSITFQNRGIGFSQIGVADEILNLIDDLEQENKQLEDLLHKANDEVISYTNCCIDLKEKIDKAIENCKKSIECINQKLQDDKTIKVVDGKVANMNEYQIVRLKAIRMKCKELLEILEGKENEQNTNN